MLTFTMDWRGYHTFYYEGYEVREVPFNYDLHQFEVVTKKDVETYGNVVAVITPDSFEVQDELLHDLLHGSGVDGWEDSNGNTISI